MRGEAKALVHDRHEDVPRVGVAAVLHGRANLGRQVLLATRDAHGGGSHGVAVHDDADVLSVGLDEPLCPDDHVAALTAAHADPLAPARGVGALLGHQDVVAMLGVVVRVDVAFGPGALVTMDEKEPSFALGVHAQGVRRERAAVLRGDMHHLRVSGLLVPRPGRLDLLVAKGANAPDLLLAHGARERGHGVGRRADEQAADLLGPDEAHGVGRGRMLGHVGPLLGREGLGTELGEEALDEEPGNRPQRDEDDARHGTEDDLVRGVAHHREHAAGGDRRDVEHHAHLEPDVGGLDPGRAVHVSGLR